MIKDLVTAAAGLDTNRGDQLVVESFPFVSTVASEPAVLEKPAAPEPAAQVAEPKWMQALARKNVMVIAGVGAGALLALIVGFVAMRRRASRRRISVEQTAAIEAAKPQQSAEELTREIESKLAVQAAEKARQEVEELMALKLPVVKTKKTDVLTRHIASEAKTEAPNLAHVVRTWLNG